MAAGGMSLKEQFANFSQFGDSRSDGTTITLRQLDKWLKQAQLLGKLITTTDTGVAFNKFKARTIDFSKFEKLLEDLATEKEMSVSDLKEKLMECGLPGTTKTTQVVGGGAPKERTDDR